MSNTKERKFGVLGILVRHIMLLALILSGITLIPHSSHSQITINEVMINAGACDGSCVPNTGEWTELYNNSSTPLNIGCYVLTDGDWSATIPAGTTIPPFGFFVIGSVNSAAAIDLDIGTCNCTSTSTSGDGNAGVFTNGNEQLVITDNSGNILDGIYWGGGQFSQAPSITTDAFTGCPSVTVNLNINNPNITSLSGSGADETVVALDCDGTGNWNTGVLPSTPNASNAVPIVFTANPTISPQTCSNLGSITLNPNGGVGPYTYQWQGSLSGNTTNFVDNLTAGNYSVLITDQGQCAPPQIFNITVTSSTTSTLTVSASTLNICLGQSTTLNADGGANYTWSPSTTIDNAVGSSVMATPLTTTTYSVQSTNNGCNETQNITIQVTSPPIINWTDNLPICEGSDLNLSVDNIPSATYNWSGPNGFFSNVYNPSISNVDASQNGNYQVIVTLNGCSSNDTHNIQFDTPVPTIIDPVGPFCIIDTPVDLNANNEPGEWTGPGITNGSQGMFNPAVANIGGNMITFDSDDYCTLPTTLLIDVVSTADASITPISALCANDNDITLSVIQAGGTWSGNAVNNLGVISPAALGVGSYSAIYSIDGACGDIDSISVVISDNPSPNISAIYEEGCSPISNNFLNSNAEPGENCTWSVDGIPVNSNCNGFNYTFSASGCHDVAIQVVNPAGCFTDQILSDIVCIDNDPMAMFEWSPLTPSLSNNIVHFHNLSMGNTYNYWDINGETSQNLDAVYEMPSTVSDYFTACLKVEGLHGCVDSTCYSIAVENEILIFVPNSFTPNEDEINNGFGPSIYGIDYADLNYKLSIFSRDGDRVYYSEDPLQKWDGDIHQGEYYGMSTLYEWVLEVAPKWEAEPQTYKGFILLLR